MKKQYLKISILVFFLSVIALNVCGQSKIDTLNQGWMFAKTELETALSESTGHNVIDVNRILIRDSAMAISVVEPILFSVYGKENIVSQRPYSVFHVDNFWILYGSLPLPQSEEGSITIVSGGTFLIIINDRNGKVIKLTHGR
jgi:hypothetical protein